ncbi:hypothetical protein E6P97_03735 [Patescibacteria group bacterium]|nr:MAG: hypothetical protein E6P97_03735 [Patescibacteria group bacterium]
MNIEERTAERLRGYQTPDGCPFSTETIDAVAEVAGRQKRFTGYERFLSYEGRYVASYVASNSYGSGVEVVEFGSPDAERTVAYHLPMGNPLDPNQLYTLGTITAANPNMRLAAFGNPSGFDLRHGGIRPRFLTRIAKGDFNPLLEPVYRWVDQSGLDGVEHVGYSYGADLASQAVLSGKHAVRSMVAIEPVVGRRNVLQLTKDFQATAEALDTYVGAVQLEGFKAARADSISEASYIKGLARPTNIAVALGLAKALFYARLEGALLSPRRDDMDATVAWGSQSELTDIDRFPARVRQWKFKEQRHAMGNDIHLQAAIVTEALRQYPAAA